MTEAELFLKERGMDVDRMSAWSENFSIRHFESTDDILNRIRTRDDHIAKFGFAILTAAAIEAIRPYAPIVEVGAGCAYWAYELRKAGVDIVATEPHPGVKGKYRGAEWAMWTEYEQLTGTAAVKKYPGRTLLSVWPDYNKSWAAATLAEFTGNVVIYVGEGHGGCTGDDSFHDALEENFKLEQNIDIPQFWGIHDRLNVYRRK